MEFIGVIVVSILCIIGLLILAAVIRYAIDSSKTSKKFDDIIKEIRSLRTELKNQKKVQQEKSKNIIDEKV
ncbi:hypothetical protein MH215_10210 [Paenibacillus sp. ACRSA]|uniref:hypothetical protein n=1 Tax=Paenibacillus sp. ACRSA TaxID=2918211 RepID=UPI001EF69002|nr:hypothetical protein [Paenibacillus sp. ACRSA]MCG7377369.1 hypothetical protein [Paenibacillus sp. ACRSA]